MKSDIAGETVGGWGSVSGCGARSRRYLRDVDEELFIGVAFKNCCGIKTFVPGLFDDCLAGAGCCFIEGDDLIEFNVTVQRGLNGRCQVVYLRSA